MSVQNDELVDIYFCPKCMKVFNTNEIIGISEINSVACNSEICKGDTFTINDYLNIKSLDIKKLDKIKIGIYVVRFLSYGFSIRKISEKMKLKKTYIFDISKTLTYELIRSKLTTSILHKQYNCKIYLEKSSNFIAQIFRRERSKRIDKLILVLYMSGCSRRLIQHLLSSINRATKLYMIDKIIKNRDEKIESVYQVSRTGEIYLYSSWVLMCLLTYQVRKPDENLQEDFFTKDIKVLKYLRENEVYITKKNLNELYRNYSLSSQKLVFLNSCIYEIQDNLVYKFDNGYELLIEFEGTGSKSVNLNNYCSKNKV